MEMKGKRALAVLFLAVLAGVFTLLVSEVLAIEPNGLSNLSVVSTERAPNDTAGTNNAEAGNITEMVITAYSTTQSWQGYIGNVSGAIRLADNSGDVLYNWTLVDPSGEIYASTNETIAWTNIQCFNFTANGTSPGSTAGETAGDNNLQGTNLSALQSEYGIGDLDADSVNNTFSQDNSHAIFYTASREFEAGECVSTDIFDSNGESTDGNFEEVILYEPSTSSVVFASLLESDLSGFDNEEYDFEMLVLEDGHGTEAGSTTPYYFFVELE